MLSFAEAIRAVGLYRGFGRDEGEGDINSDPVGA